MSGLSGTLPATYGSFATDAGPPLDAAAGADNQLSSQLHDAAGTDRSGRMSSGSVVNGAAADTASLAPVSATPAGQRALIAALRTRVAQQQQVVTAHKAQDARLAALIRSLMYSRRAASAGMTTGAAPFGAHKWAVASSADRRCLGCRAFRRPDVVNFLIYDPRAPPWNIATGRDRRCVTAPSTCSHACKPRMR